MKNVSSPPVLTSANGSAFTTFKQMRAVAIGVSMVVFFAACGQGDVLSTPTTSTTSTTFSEDSVNASGEVSGLAPSVIVSEWFDAVVEGEVDLLIDLVESSGFVVLAGIENEYSESEIAVLLDSGMPEDLVSEYWTTFSRGFSEVADISLASIEVGGHVEFSMGANRFAVVEITSGDASTEVITRRQTTEWKLDLIASFGPAFAAQLRRLVAGLSQGPEAEIIREAFRRDILSGLQAAFRQSPDNTVLAQEIERIALFVFPE